MEITDQLIAVSVAIWFATFEVEVVDITKGFHNVDSSRTERAPGLEDGEIEVHRSKWDFEYKWKNEKLLLNEPEAHAEANSVVNCKIMKDKKKKGKRHYWNH